MQIKHVRVLPEMYISMYMYTSLFCMCASLSFELWILRLVCVCARERESVLGVCVERETDGDLLVFVEVDARLVARGLPHTTTHITLV